MFRKNDIDVYRSITAPDSLKKRVLMLQQPTNFKPWYQRYGVLIAACFAIIFLLSSTILLNLSSQSTTLLVQGMRIGSSPVELTRMAPTAKMTSLPNEDSFTTVLECKVSGYTAITVSGGMIYEATAPTVPADSLTVCKDTNLYWTVVPSESTSSYWMNVSSRDSVDTYVLEQNKETGIWTIFQK